MNAPRIKRHVDGNGVDRFTVLGFEKTELNVDELRELRAVLTRAIENAASRRARADVDESDEPGADECEP